MSILKGKQVYVSDVCWKEKEKNRIKNWIQVAEEILTKRLYRSLKPGYMVPSILEMLESQNASLDLPAKAI